MVCLALVRTPLTRDCPWRFHDGVRTGWQLFVWLILCDAWSIIFVISALDLDVVENSTDLT